MIEVGLQKAAVQIPGRWANMNHSQDTEVMTLILSFNRVAL